MLNKEFLKSIIFKWAFNKSLGLIALTFLIISIELQAQYCNVSLLEKGTNLPVLHANVCWQLLSNDKLKGYTISSENGTISLPVGNNEQVVLSVTCIGFRLYSDTIKSNAANAIYLEPDIFNLEQVTVTGTRTPRTLKETPVLTQLITRKEIKGVTASTIKDVLETEVPGVEMNRHGYGISMTAQGLEPQYTLILVDGERMAGESGGNVDFSRINAANIERIEIVRGASSALYGSNAMGGVINIITRQPHKKWDIEIETRYSQPNQDNVTKSQISSAEEKYIRNFLRNQDWPNINTDLSIGYRNKGFYTNTYLGFKSFDAYQLLDTKGLRKYYPALDSTSVEPVSTTPTYLNGFMDYSISNKTGFTVKDSWNFELRGNYYNHEEFDFVRDSKHDLYRNYTIGGYIDKKLNSKSSLKFSYNTDVYNKYDALEKKESNTLNYSNIFHNGKLTYNINIRDKHNILGGIENLYESLNTDMFIYDTLTRKNANDLVLVLQDEYKIADKLILTVGLRSGYHSTYKEHFTPSATLKYSIKNIHYRLSYARGYRSPSLKELYMNWSHLGMFTIIGSTGLKPETSNYYAFSADYINTDKKLNITLISSYNHISDKIDGIWSDDETEYRYMNFKEFKVLNTELLFKYKFLNAIQLKTGYVYTKVFEEEAAVNLSTVSPHALTAQAEYTFSKEKYNLTINFSGKLTGKKSYSVLDDELDTYYEVSHPTYSIWNITINQRFGKHISFSTGIKNIFDYVAPIVTFNTSSSAGRRYFISAGYNF